MITCWRWTITICSDLKHLAGSSDAEIGMFLSYTNNAGITSVEEVPDPYYSGGFDRYMT